MMGIIRKLSPLYRRTGNLFPSLIHLRNVLTQHRYHPCEVAWILLRHRQLLTLNRQVTGVPRSQFPLRLQERLRLL